MDLDVRHNIGLFLYEFVLDMKNIDNLIIFKVKWHVRKSEKLSFAIIYYLLPNVEFCHLVL